MNEEKKFEVVRFVDGEIELDVNVSPSEDTVWLTIEQLAILFGRDRSVISKHISNIFDERKLEKKSVCAFFAHTANDGKTYNVKYYNLDVIISVGYRVKSKNLETFYKWAKDTLKSLKKYEIMEPIIKFEYNNIVLDVNVSPSEETVWLSKEQLCLLFDTTRQNLDYHINSIYMQDELDEGATCKKILQVQIENNRQVNRTISIFNLDMIISLGYRINSKNGILFRKWANKVLKEYLLKGYVIDENRVTVSNENYIELKNEVVDINNRLLKIEDKVLSNSYFKDKILFNGEFYDAYSLIQNIIEKANDEIIIIDNYIDRSILDMLVVKKKKVIVKIYTSNKSKLLPNDINHFNKQYNNLTIKYIDKVHDRFIIIDNNKLYHLGHSIKDLGKKISSICELDNRLINELLNNL